MTDKRRFTESSGNVFADLGLPDAGSRLAKAELARRITREIEERELTQREAAEILGIDQPKASAITRGRLKEFSLDRLLTFVGRLGLDVEIVVSANPEPARPPRLVVHNVDRAVAAAG
jgi:predicted XRE-type DNA-binding protein